MLKASDFYIDLGTANTVICSAHKGTLLNEPSAITTCSKLGRTGTFAVGIRAKSMLGKTPRRLSVHQPLRDGVIADFDITARMLNGFMQRIRKSSSFCKPRLIISLPYRVSFHESQAVREIGLDLGAKSVKLLHEPVAAAIGANLPVFEKSGSMIVDIGGGTTEIAIISAGGIVKAEAVRTGGNHIDEAISQLLRSKYQLSIGPQTAEKIKISVASALLGGLNHSVHIGGLDCTTGLPVRLRVDSRMIFPAVDIVLRNIISAIKEAFCDCPPDIAGDIEQAGILLAGGGALMHQLRARISQDLNLSVDVAKDPLLSVTRGGLWALNKPKQFETLEEPS